MGDRYELARTGQRLSPPLMQPYRSARRISELLSARRSAAWRAATMSAKARFPACPRRGREMEYSQMGVADSRQRPLFNRGLLKTRRFVAVHWNGGGRHQGVPVVFKASRRLMVAVRP